MDSTKLPNTDPTQMVEGGWNLWAGQIKDMESEADAAYGYQIKIISTTPDTKSGEMFVWLSFGKEYRTDGLVSSTSKGGLFLARVNALIGKFKWEGLVGMWVIWKREHHDFGNRGVHDVWLPVVMSKKPLTIEDYAPASGQEPGPDEDAPEEAPVLLLPGTLVRQALQMMDGRTDKAFRAMIGKSKDLESILDPVLSGEFQAYALSQGWVRANKATPEKSAQPYDVVDVPDEEDTITLETPGSERPF